MERNLTGFSASEMERAALCSMMLSREAATMGALHLTPGHFSVPVNRTLFEALRDFFNEVAAYDYPLFCKFLEKRGSLASVGGPAAVSEMDSVVPSGANVRFYINGLNEYRDGRDAAAIMRKAIGEVEQDAAALPEVIANLSEIPLRKIHDRTFRDAIMDKLDRMENGDPTADIIPTGLTKLDHESPLRRGDMPLIAGERKAGKSILALSLAVNVARAGTPVLYFSLEDREPKVIDRIFAGTARIPVARHHLSRMTEGDMSKTQNAIKLLAELRIQIRDDVYDLHRIMALTKQAVAGNTAGLAVIDYAQLVRCEGCETRRMEVEKVSRDLRLLAMELNIPILLICQLNKDGETRETKALEMDATAMWQIEEDDSPNERRIKIPWQRNGESGIMFRVTFLGELARVENYFD